MTAPDADAPAPADPSGRPAGSGLVVTWRDFFVQLGRQIVGLNVRKANLDNALRLGDELLTTGKTNVTLYTRGTVMRSILSAFLFVLLLGTSSEALAQGAATGFLDRTVTISGEAYRYQVFVPADYTRSRTWPVVLFLHGGGERGTDGLIQTEVGIGSAIRRFSSRFPAIVVMPQARAPLGWTGANADMALKALDQTEVEFNIDRGREYLTGLSMGGAGTWYVSYRHPNRFAALLAICARVRPSATTSDPVVPAADGEPFATLAARVKHLPIWVFHGDADNTVPVDESRGVVAALKALNVPVKYSELPGIGHNSWDAAYRAPEVAEWLFAQKKN